MSDDVTRVMVPDHGDDGEGDPAAGGAALATLLRGLAVDDLAPVDVDALLASAARRRRAHVAERVLAVAATVVVVAAVGLGVVHLRTPVQAPTGATIALPRTVLGPDSDYPYAVPYAVHGGAPTVVVWTDPQCPVCGQFEPTAGLALRRLADAGAVTLIQRPTLFLDAAHPESRDSSLRAVEGWGCALDEDANLGQRYYDRVLTHQPAVEGQGWTDAQLGELAAQSGLWGTGLDRFLACLSSGRYEPWARASLSEFLRLGVQGTPTVLVDGTEVSSTTFDTLVADPTGWLAAHT